jgi:Ras-related C3 botulinum toxin substrate 1
LDTNIFLICFSIINPTSFYNVKYKWYNEIKLNAPTNIPIILVGTKLDLRNDEKEIKKLKMKNEIPITYEEGIKLKKELGFYNYFECSAKEQYNLNELFEYCVKIVYKSLKKQIKFNNKNKKEKKKCLIL